MSSHHRARIKQQKGALRDALREMQREEAQALREQREARQAAERIAREEARQAAIREAMERRDPALKALIARTAGLSGEALLEGVMISLNQADAFGDGEIAGCYCCTEIFLSAEITSWIDGGRIALCPYCGVDAVMSDGAARGITKEKLEALYDGWFGMSPPEERPPEVEPEPPWKLKLTALWARRREVSARRDDEGAQ